MIKLFLLSFFRTTEEKELDLPFPPKQIKTFMFSLEKIKKNYVRKKHK